MGTVAFNIEMDASGPMRLTERLTKFGDHPPLIDSARALEQRMRQTFRSEADPRGNPWPPLSPVTLAQRARRGNASVQALIDTGTLYDSLHSEQLGNDAQVVIGGPGMWPNVHQFGNPDNLAWGRGSAPIPARAFAPISEAGADVPDEWMRDMTAPIEAKLAEAVA